MTVHHMVWLQVPERVSEADMENLVSKIRGLKTIPAVMDISVGRNYRDADHGYQYGVLMTYPDRDAQRAYMEHDLHQALRGEIQGMGITLAALDFED